MTTRIDTAPLAHLSLHHFNPRQTHDDADIQALAKSIVVNGLMQNLNVLQEGDADFGVVAGGRRLRALQLIAAGNVDMISGPGLDIDFGAIPVHLTTDPVIARSWAGTEGATQRPLHPAEEIRAYGAMHAEHQDAETIAKAFGQTVAHVKRRLKLANLSEATLDALRADKITLDAAQVLTVAGSETREAELLEMATTGRASANSLRYELSQGKVRSDDRRVRYIGLDLYTAEGGALDEDLFNDQSLLHNADLVDKLFKLKLTKAAEDLQAGEGWAQVVPVMEGHIGFEHYDGMQRIFRKPVDLPDGDQGRLEELETIGDEREFTDAEAAELDALEIRAAGDFDADERAQATLFICVDHGGTLRSGDMAYIRKDAPASADAGEGTATKVEAKPAITQGGIEDLHRIQLLALQTEMLNQPERIVDLLTFQLWHELPSWAGAFNIQATDQDSAPSDTANVSIHPRISGADETAEPLSGNMADDFAAFVAKGKKHRNTTLATLLTRTMNKPFGSKLNHALLDALDINPRKVWTPTAENFFKACRSEYLDSIWRTLVTTDDDSDDMARFAKLKVGEKRNELEALFSDASVQEALGLSRAQVAAIDAWVPAEMNKVTM